MADDAATAADDSGRLDDDRYGHGDQGDASADQAANDPAAAAANAADRSNAIHDDIAPTSTDQQQNSGSNTSDGGGPIEGPIAGTEPQPENAPDDPSESDTVAAGRDI